MRLLALIGVAACLAQAASLFAQPQNAQTGKPNQVDTSAARASGEGKPVILDLPAGQDAFVVDDLAKISPDGKLFSRGTGMEDYARKNTTWDGKAIALSGAKGERVAFQVIVRGGAQGLDGMDVTCGDLASPAGATKISAKNFVMYRQWYTQVTTPSTSPFGNSGLGWYPDALIPSQTPKFGLPMKVEAGKLQGIWVDLLIPADAQAGKYQGQVVVSGSGRADQTIPLTLEVYNFSMPAQRHMRFRIGYSGFEEVANHYNIQPGSEEFQKIEDDLFKMCWEDCRFVPTTHYGTPRLPYKGTGDSFRFDWTSYDRRFGTYLDGSAFADKQPVNIWSLPVAVDGGIPTGGRSADLKALDTELLSGAVKDIVRHWAEKGWNLDGSFVYVADEPDPTRYAFIKKACETVLKASDNKIRTSVALYTHFGATGPALVKEFSGYITMWDIAGDYMNLNALAARQKAGDFIGFYQGSEPYQGSEALDGDGLSMATWPVIAWRNKLDTLFLYNMTEWTYFRLDRGSQRPWAKLKREIWEQPLNQSWQTNSQGVLLYPGQYVGVRGVIPSIRMKQIRRGMQDYEYYWLLAQKGQPAKADEFCNQIMPVTLGGSTGVKFGDSEYGEGKWQRDPRKWADVRRQMAELLAK